MTAATSARSSGAITSFSTSDAMIRTSYGVRFLDFAYERSTCLPVLLKAWSCCLTSWLRRRLRLELIRRREEEALERPALAVARERRRKLRAGRRREVGLRRELRVDLPLLAGDLVDRLDPRGHLLPREALREDDLERRRRGDRRRRRFASSLAADAADRLHDEPAHEAEAAGKQDERDRPPRRDPAARGGGRRGGGDVPHRGALLDHVR